MRPHECLGEPKRAKEKPRLPKKANSCFKETAESVKCSKSVELSANSRAEESL